MGVPSTQGLWSGSYGAFQGNVFRSQQGSTRVGDDSKLRSLPLKVVVPSVEKNTEVFAEPMYVTTSIGLAQDAATLSALDRCAAAESTARMLSQMLQVHSLPPGLVPVGNHEVGVLEPQKALFKLTDDVICTAETSDESDAQSHASASSSYMSEPSMCK